MKFSLGQIAAMLGGTLEGPAQAEVSTISKIEEAQPGSIAFLANPKYIPYLYTTQATAVLISTEFEPQQPVAAALIRVPDPYSAFTTLLGFADRMLRQAPRGIHERAVIAPSARVGEGVYIGPNAYVGEHAVIGDGVAIYPGVCVGDHVKIGKETVIQSNVTIYHRCEIGDRCTIHAGTVIGSDGFGFAPQADGSYKKVPQLGNVLIGDDVEIGANTVIDRATMGSTRIGNGVKLDNLIQIAHNVEIGVNTAVAAQAGISGSTKIGEQCVIGGQAGIVGHLQIAAHTKIDAQTGVARSVKEEGQALRGSPAQPYRQQLRSEIVFMQLDQLAKEVARLRKLLDNNE